MPRMSILNADEKEAFDSPPLFNSVQRKLYFDVTPRIASKLDTLKTPTNQVSFLVIAAYFKATKRFFCQRFCENDLEYPESYQHTTYRRHQQFILDLLGFNKWDGEAKYLVANEIRDMIRSQARAKFIFRHIVDILEHRRIEIPGSWALSELILEETKQHKRRLTATIDGSLPQHTRDFLEELPSH